MNRDQLHWATLHQTDHTVTFGELALIKNQLRAATIQCLEDCHFAVIQKDDYEKVLQKIEQKKISKMIDFLHSLPLFKFFTRTSLSKI